MKSDLNHTIAEFTRQAAGFSEAPQIRDEEALRVVREAQFIPGKQRGKAVPVKMSLPITFKLRG